MAVWRGRSVAALGAATLLLTSCIDFDDGGTILARPSTSARATGVAFADVAARGVADPIIVTSDGRLVRATSCGSGCWQVQEEVVLDGPATSMATSDLDGDGVDDVVVATDVGTRAYLGGPARGPRPAGLVATHSVVVDATMVEGTVVTGDLDGDGDSDVGIAGVSNDPSWPIPRYVEVLGDGDGGFAPAVIRAEWISPGSTVSGPAVGDIDGNGDDEVLFGEGHVLLRTAYLHAYGDDPVDDALSVEINYQRDLAAGDLNGDGRDELLARSPSLAPDYPAVIQVWCATGTTYQSCGSGPGSGVLHTGSFGSGPIAVADLDGDGRNDVIAADGQTDRLATWRGLGDGRFAQYRSGARLDQPIDDWPSALAVEPDADLPDVLVGLLDPGAPVQHLDNVSTVP